MTASQLSTYNDALVERLNVASLPYRDPVAEIPWEELDPARPWLPERLVSLYGLPEYASLTETQRLRLTQVEFVATAEFGLWLESLFLSRFTHDSLHQLDASPPAYRYQLHELREEVGHSLMFLELMHRSGVPMLTPVGRRVRLAGLFARLMSAQSPLFRAAVFVGEAGIEGIVGGERIVPHRGPKIVGFQPQQEFEQVCVKAVIEPAEFFLGPAGERGRFVIEENPPVFDDG